MGPDPGGALGDCLGHLGSGPGLSKRMPQGSLEETLNVNQERGGGGGSGVEGEWYVANNGYQRKAKRLLFVRQ